MGKSHSPSRIPKPKTLKSGENTQETPIKPESSIPKPTNEKNNVKTQQEDLKVKLSVTSINRKSKDKSRENTKEFIKAGKSKSIGIPKSKFVQSRENTQESLKVVHSNTIINSKDSMNDRDQSHKDRYDQSQSPRFNYDYSPKPKSKSNALPTTYNRDIPTYYKPQTAQETTQSNFSKVFRDSRNFPSFDKDFGPMGTTVLNTRHQHEGSPLEDIAKMFPRADATPLPPINLETKYNSRRSPEASIPRWSTNAYQSPRYTENIKNSSPVRLTYTSKDLDDILAKYKSKPQSTSAPAANEYLVYNAIVSPNKYTPHVDAEKDPDFTRPPYGKHNNNGSGCYTNGDLKNVKENCDFEGDKLNRAFDHPSKEHHRFPFKETINGELIVLPEQIAFESKTMSVLVSDPTKISSIRSEKIPSLHQQDHFVAHLEEAIHQKLSQMYDKNDTKFGFPTVADGPKEWTVPEDEYEGKEMVHIRYSSNSTQGAEKLMKDIHQRIRSGRNADTHVMIGNKVYPCHSLVLEVYSSFFDNLSRPKNSMRKVNLPETEVSQDIFPIVMDWIMETENGRGSVINKSNVISLFSAAKYLDMPELIAQCVNFLHEKVETNDRYLMHLWEEVKRRPNCQELMGVISNKAAASFQHIYKERQFLKLDVDELVMLLSSDDIVIDSELDAYYTAIRWLLKDWDPRKIYTNQVMSTVRFGLLTPLQLTRIAHSPEMSKDDDLKDYSEVLTYGSVKSMIDDGLAYSIVDESYKAQPEELKKWIESTGIKQPRTRTHILQVSEENLSEKIVLNPSRKEMNNVLHPTVSRIGRTPSYTIVRDGHSDPSSNKPLIDSHDNLNFKDTQESSHHRSVIQMFENKSNTIESDMIQNDGSRTSSLSKSRSYRPTTSVSSRHTQSSRSRENTKRNNSPTSHSHLEDAAEKAGQPIRNEDIEYLGPENSRSRSRTSSPSDRKPFNINSMKSNH